MATRHSKTIIGRAHVVAMVAAIAPAFGMKMMPTSAPTICPCNLRYFL